MKIWKILPPVSPEFLTAHSEIHPLLLQLMFNRGLKETADLELIMQDADFYDPFLFKNMSAAVDLIIKHLSAGNKIMVYGDYDADGVTSSVILLETLKILHGQAEVYLPDRTSEGYGLNRLAIDRFVQDGFKLIITVDNGIRNKEEVLYAQEMGLEVLITDHHILPKKEDLPSCLYLDPADPEDNYPWKYLAGVGVAFKLISGLLAKAKLSATQKKLIQDKALDLVAVGTIADLVNILGENRYLVKKGLEVLNKTKRLGLRELIKVAKINRGRPLESWNVAWQIGPRLNAASRLAHANSAFSLLTTTDQQEAQRLAQELNQRNLDRQKITKEILLQVEEQIDSQHLPLVIIAVAPVGQDWNEGVIGLVAGRITEKYYRPSLIVTRSLDGEQTVFKGSGRSIPEFNLIAGLEDGSQYLDKYGGHPMACGFSLIGEENLSAFQKKLETLAGKKLDVKTLFPKLNIEAVLNFSEINLELIQSIKVLAPYGQNNPQPSFVSYNLEIQNIITMGAEQQHIKFSLSSQDSHTGQTNSLWAIAFGASKKYQEFEIGDHLDLVYYLEINDFNGRRSVQLKVVDIKKNDSESEPDSQK